MFTSLSVWCWCSPPWKGKCSNLIPPPGPLRALTSVFSRLPPCYFVICSAHDMTCSGPFFILNILIKISSTFVFSLIYDACFLSPCYYQQVPLNSFLCASGFSLTPLWDAKFLSNILGLAGSVGHRRLWIINSVKGIQVFCKNTVNGQFSKS